MYIIPIFYFVVIALLLLFPPLLQGAYMDIGHAVELFNLNFWMSTIAISTIVFYIKSNYRAREKELLRISEELDLSNKSLLRKNVELEKNRVKLENTNKVLDEMVNSRTVELSNSNESIKNYITLSTKEIQDPIKRTLELIEDLGLESDDEESSRLLELLKNSAIELKEINKNINEHLVKDGRFSRKDIK